MALTSSFRTVLLLAGMALLIALDFEAGALIHISMLFLVPVSVVALSGSLAQGLALATGLPLIHALLAPWFEQPVDLFSLGINTFLEMAVFAAAAATASQLVGRSREQEKNLDAVSGFFSICSFCKSLRPPGRDWVAVDEYLHARTPMRLSHGVCPRCAKKYYGEYLAVTAQRKSEGRKTAPLSGAPLVGNEGRGE